MQERYARDGERAATQVGGYRRSRVADKASLMRGWINERKDLTLVEISERLAESGVVLKTTALWHQLDQWNLRLKKTLHASEQARKDVAKARAAWKAHQPTLAVKQLIVIDATGASTTMTRLRGRAPVGARCVSPVPHGHWQTTPCIAGLRVGAVVAPMGLDGPMDGEAFLV